MARTMVESTFDSLDVGDTFQFIGRRGQPKSYVKLSDDTYGTPITIEDPEAPVKIKTAVKFGELDNFDRFVYEDQNYLKIPPIKGSSGANALCEDTAKYETFDDDDEVF